MASTSISARAVVITGASTGIGEACALELDRLGYRVFAGVRSEAAAAKLREKASSRLTPLMIDVTHPDSIAAAAKLVGEAVGEAGLAGLVNNAGIAVPGPVELVPIDAWRRQLEVNVIGPVAMLQAFLPLLRKARGRVVNIGSIHGGVAAPYLGAYSSSKHAMEAITDVLRVELRRWGIRVSMVEPGPISTPIWEKSAGNRDGLLKGVTPETAALYEADLAAVKDYVDRSIHTASPVARVVRAVVHALGARRPKTRYFLGYVSRICFREGKLAPDHFRDWVVRQVAGLTRQWRTEPRPPSLIGQLYRKLFAPRSPIAEKRI
jgi:NAD(P)-dependent dehydrogenase (short-subunit alcohol dehydrogenase family)